MPQFQCMQSPGRMCDRGFSHNRSHKSQAQNKRPFARALIRERPGDGTPSAPAKSSEGGFRTELKPSIRKLLYRAKLSRDRTEVDRSPAHGNARKQAAIGLVAPELLPGPCIESIDMPRAFSCRELVVTYPEVDHAITHYRISDRPIFRLESPQPLTRLGVERVEELVFVPSEDRSAGDGSGGPNVALAPGTPQDGPGLAVDRIEVAVTATGKNHSRADRRPIPPLCVCFLQLPLLLASLTVKRIESILRGKEDRSVIVCGRPQGAPASIYFPPLLLSSDIDGVKQSIGVSKVDCAVDDQGSGPHDVLRFELPE